MRGRTKFYLTKNNNSRQPKEGYVNNGQCCTQKTTNDTEVRFLMNIRLYRVYHRGMPQLTSGNILIIGA